MYHIPKICLSPLSTITQRNHRPHMIYKFTWSGINKISACLAPKETMLFGNTLQYILHRIQNSDPDLGPVYLRKIDLVNVYM